MSHPLSENILADITLEFKGNAEKKKGPADPASPKPHCGKLCL
jgi:hypothetical protein